jgi:hypothetical protein
VGRSIWGRSGVALAWLQNLTTWGKRTGWMGQPFHDNPARPLIMSGGGNRHDSSMLAPDLGFEP